MSLNFGLVFVLYFCGCCGCCVFLFVIVIVMVVCIVKVFDSRFIDWKREEINICYLNV